MPHTLSVLGAGNMGAAILRGVVDAGVIPADRILVIEPDDDRRDAMAALGCATGTDPAAARDAEQILLAVKPQSFPALAAAVGRLERPTVVISIMAGLSSGNIRTALGEHARVVRVMPNTPARIRKGASALAIGEGADESDAELARRVFASVGTVVPVEEAHIYAVTAVSGGGPAYVFLLAESMERAAIDLGIAADAARALVVGTVAGAGALLESSGEEPAALREAVTSKRGTTYEALQVMFRRELPDIVAEGLAAATERGRELDG